RIGGFERDWSPAAWAKIHAFMDEFPAVWEAVDQLLTRNTIFMNRCINVGGISAEKAISYGFTGPNLRAAGVDYDIRKIDRYSAYEDFGFDVPVGKSGATYDGYMVRQEEVHQSSRIIRQPL